LEYPALDFEDNLDESINDNLDEDMNDNLDEDINDNIEDNNVEEFNITIDDEYLIVKTKITTKTL